MTGPAPSPDFTRRCGDCLHVTRRGTCLEPVAAGLIPASAGFGIAWPGPMHAATCDGYALEARKQVQEPAAAAAGAAVPAGLENAATAALVALHAAAQLPHEEREHG